MAKEQMMSCGLHLDVPAGGDKPVTEAAFKRWLAAQLKNCPFGTLTVGDPVDFSEDMIERAKRHRQDAASRK